MHACVCVCLCVCACMHVCVCVRACVRACMVHVCVVGVWVDEWHNIYAFLNKPGPLGFPVLYNTAQITSLPVEPALVL